MVKNGQNDHFGQNDLIPNWILAFARPKWTKMVHFGPKRSILVHLGPPTVLLWPVLNLSWVFTIPIMALGVVAFLAWKRPLITVAVGPLS